MFMVGRLGWSAFPNNAFIIFFHFISSCLTEPVDNPDKTEFLVSNYMGQLSIESLSTSRVIANDLAVLEAVDFIMEENLVFYVGKRRLKHNELVPVIKATNLTSLQTYSVYTARLRSLDAISIDWVNMMAYWADFKEKVIEVGEIDIRLMSITKHAILFSQDLDDLNSLVVDPLSRSIYWLRSSAYTKIETAGMDGSQRSTIFYDANSSGRELSLDPIGRRLFWISPDRLLVASINLLGRDLSQTRVPGFDSWKTAFLNVVSGRIFLAHELSISSIPEGQTNRLSLRSHLNLTYQPYALRVYGRDSQPIQAGPNRTNCVPEKFRYLTLDGSTGCDFLCLNSPSQPKYACKCPTGVPYGATKTSLNDHLLSNSPQSTKFLVQQSISCPDFPQQFLLIARPPGIFMLSLQVKDEESHLFPVGSSPGPRRTPVRVDFDPLTKSLFWVDNAIYRLKLGEKSPVVVIEPANRVAQTLDGLAVDWVAGNLYWSTGGNRQIWVSRLDGAWPRLLLTLHGFDDCPPSSSSSSQDRFSSFNCSSPNTQPSDPPVSATEPVKEEPIKRRPAALAVDPINRYLFFNVWSGNRGRVERTWLDGTHREIVVDQEHTVWPNGIALDVEAQHLYYVDAYLAVIQRVDYAGGKPIRIVSGGLQHPFGFDLLGDKLFWSDWQTLEISQANKHDGSDLRVLKTLGVDDMMMGIRAVDLSIKDIAKKSVCGNKKLSGCSHLCFTLPSMASSSGSSRSNNSRYADKNHDPSSTNPHLYYCSCPPEYALDSDGKTCVVPESMLLYSIDGAGLRKMSLPKVRPHPFIEPPLASEQISSDLGSIPPAAAEDIEIAAAEIAAVTSDQVFNQVPLPFLTRVLRFDVHIAEERIYWVEDINPQCISMAFLNGTGKETLLCLFRDFRVDNAASHSNTRDSVVGLALDWLTNSLYFCVDGEQPRLEVIDLKYRTYTGAGNFGGGSGDVSPFGTTTDFDAAQPGGPRLSRYPSQWYRSSRYRRNARVRRNALPFWLMRSSKGTNPSGPQNDYDLNSANYEINAAADRIPDSVDNYRLVLLHNLSSPRDLVVHPRKRLLFWLDGAQNTRFNIYSAGLDGRNHRLIWNGVGIVMSLSLDYTTDRLYWLNWVTRCIESISLNGEPWFAINPILPGSSESLLSTHPRRKPDGTEFFNSLPPNDFHPYAIDAYQGSVLFSELTTQSVYRVQVPTSRPVQPGGHFPSAVGQVNLPADLLLRGPSGRLGGHNFLVLGLFVAGFDRQTSEPGHRCSPSSWSQMPPSGPICQALCLGAPPAGRSDSQPFAPIKKPPLSAQFPHSRPIAPSLFFMEDRTPGFTCACPTQFTLASDGYSCLEPLRSMLLLTADGSITRYTPDDHPNVNLLSISTLSVPTHDLLTTNAAWNSAAGGSAGFYGSSSDYQSEEGDELTGSSAFPSNDFSIQWATGHRVAAVALEELTNSGVFYLLRPVSSRGVASGRRGAGKVNAFYSSKPPSTPHQRRPLPLRGYTPPHNLMRLAFLDFATGRVRLLEGGPLVFLMDESTAPLNSQERMIDPHNITHSSAKSPSARSIGRGEGTAVVSGLQQPRWDLTFDPINQLLFWSDSVTGHVGVEDARTGASLGLIANASDNSRTVLEIVVEARSGQLFWLTASQPDRSEFYPPHVWLNCRIEITYLDGSFRRLLHDASQTSCPHSLAYSAKLARLYWADPNTGEIKTIQVPPPHRTPTESADVETAVVGAYPIPKTLTVLPEKQQSHFAEKSDPASAFANGPRLMWFQLLSSTEKAPYASPRQQQQPHQRKAARLLYAPIGQSRKAMAPLVPPGLHSKFWPSGVNAGQDVFPLPVRGGGLGDLSWHPCAGPLHGGCSHLCLPKATASSPSMPLYPGPLTPSPPLASTIPASLWLTARRCACMLGSNILEQATDSKTDAGTVCSQVQACASPNLFCRAGLATVVRDAPFGEFFLVGSNGGGGGFPHRGFCLPVHRICDGVVDCKDGSDETNCPATCPEYECNDGQCLPFTSRCNGMIECDSDEACCGPDQFECRRPQPRVYSGDNSQLMSRADFPSGFHRYYRKHSSPAAAAWERCIPMIFFCDGKADCHDNSDEATCASSAVNEFGDAPVHLSGNGSTRSSAGPPAINSSGSMNGEFPSVYAVIIVLAILVVLVVISLIGYFCSKGRSLFSSPYLVRSDKLDLVLIPTGDKNSVNTRTSFSVSTGQEGLLPLITHTTTITAKATVTSTTSGSAGGLEKRRARRRTGGLFSRHHAQLGTSLSSSVVAVNANTGAISTYKSQVVRTTSSKCGTSGRQCGSHEGHTSSRTLVCEKCCLGSATVMCTTAGSNQKGCRNGQHHHHHHDCQQFAGRLQTLPCRCGAFSDVDSFGSCTHIQDSEHWSPSQCPPAPPPSSLPSPPPSPSRLGSRLSPLFGSPTTPPPAPPPSKLHGASSSSDSCSEQSCPECGKKADGDDSANRYFNRHHDRLKRLRRRRCAKQTSLQSSELPAATAGRLHRRKPSRLRARIGAHSVCTRTDSCRDDSSRARSCVPLQPEPCCAATGAIHGTAYPDRCPQCGSRAKRTTSRRRDRTRKRSATVAAQCSFSYLQCTLHSCVRQDGGELTRPVPPPSSRALRGSRLGRAASFSPNCGHEALSAVVSSQQRTKTSPGRAGRQRKLRAPCRSATTPPLHNFTLDKECATRAAALSDLIASGIFNFEEARNDVIATASSASCTASQFGRKLRIGSLFGPLSSTSAGNTAMVEHAAVTFRVETNSSSSSASSSSCQASSNISSEFFPRETVNPPPSPITESIYTSLPPFILKQPNISRKASMSTSSGSSGPRNDGFSSLSFETLGNDKDSDQRIIATVGNLGRAGVGSSRVVYDHLGTSGNLATAATLSSLKTSKTVGLTDGQGLGKYLSQSPLSRQPCQDPAVLAKPEPCENQMARPSSSSISVVADVKQSTTHIQNLHVVIVTSRDEQTPGLESIYSPSYHQHDPHAKSRRYTPQLRSPGEYSNATKNSARHRHCGRHGVLLRETSGSEASSSSGGSRDQGRPVTFKSYSKSRRPCQFSVDCTKAQGCRCSGNSELPDVPIEPREQAEGAEDESPSAAARAPFAQILDSEQKPAPVKEVTNE